MASLSNWAAVVWLDFRAPPPPPQPSHQDSQALHEGGVAGVVEGLALTGRRLPPLECLGILCGMVRPET